MSGRRAPPYPGHAEQGGEVVDLALDLVWRGVGALAPAAPVVVDDGEPLRERLGELLRPQAVAEDAGGDTQRLPWPMRS